MTQTIKDAFLELPIGSQFYIKDGWCMDGVLCTKESYWTYSYKKMCNGEPYGCTKWIGEDGQDSGKIVRK